MWQAAAAMRENTAKLEDVALLQDLRNALPAITTQKEYACLNKT